MMEAVLNTINLNWNEVIRFFSANLEVVVLSSLIFIQWMGLQAFAIHYYFFRKSISRKKPEGLRIATLEKLVAFQAEQIERAFSQIADHKTEMRDFMRDRVSLVEEKKAQQSQSTKLMDSGYVSLGELNLKKKLDAMRASTRRAH